MAGGHNEILGNVAAGLIDVEYMAEIRRKRLVFKTRRELQYRQFQEYGWGKFSRSLRPRHHRVTEVRLDQDGHGVVRYACGRTGRFGRIPEPRGSRVEAVEPAIVKTRPELACLDCGTADFKLDLTIPGHAYLVGLAQTDGYLSNGGSHKGRFEIELQAGDENVLMALQAMVPHHSLIRHRTRTTNFIDDYASVVWTVTPRGFRSLLLGAGVPVGRKSMVVAPPPPPYVESDYFRGLVDGDGSIGFTARNIPFVSLTTSSDAIATAYLGFLKSITGKIKTCHRNRRDDVYNLMVMREDAVMVASILYPEGCLAISRKSEAATQVRNWRRPTKMKRISSAAWDHEQDLVVLANPDRIAAKWLGRSLRSVAMRRFRLRGGPTYR